MNKVVLMGRLTKDPDIRSTTGGMSVAKYILAVDRKGKKEGRDGQTADFIVCTAFDHRAEFAEKYLRQGMKIAVVGRLVTGSYTNRDGVKVYTTEVYVDDQEFAESKSASDNRQQSRGEKENRSGYTPSSVGDGFMNLPDGIEDDLPFK